jgi:hypothetical protein
MNCPHDGMCLDCSVTTGEDPFITKNEYNIHAWFDLPVQLYTSPEVRAYITAKKNLENFNPAASHKSKKMIRTQLATLEENIRKAGVAVVELARTLGIC